jgi:hypothetical protein
LQVKFVIGSTPTEGHNSGWIHVGPNLGWGLGAEYYRDGAVLSGEGRAVPIDDAKGVNIVNISSN